MKVEMRTLPDEEKLKRGGKERPPGSFVPGKRNSSKKL